MKKETVLIFGGDGYLGWSLGLAFAHRTDFNVVLADNMIKRQWEKEVGAKSLVPFKKIDERILKYRHIFSKTNLLFEKIELLNYDEIIKIIKKYKPSIIINAAQQPSAPFSMMNAKNSAATFNNNVIGHLNALWAISETDKNIKYIKLGSAGCYSGIDSDYVPLEKVNLKFNHKGIGHEVLKTWFPMNATDFYHQSKIDDFILNDLASNVWKLKIVTVQQSTIFGATIAENYLKKNRSLSTRFNYDSVFGTVINRFICQLQLKAPLTIYGAGDQVTGLISLSDTIDNFINIAKMDVLPGEHKIVHNYTLRMSINEIAEIIKEVDNTATVLHIKNPRKEIDGSLKKVIEVHAVIKASHRNKNDKFKKELLNLIEFVGRYKNKIDASVIMPRILWEKEQKSSQRMFLMKKSSLTTRQ